jgi:hypothetical protein
LIEKGAGNFSGKKNGAASNSCRQTPNAPLKGTHANTVKERFTDIGKLLLALSSLSFTESVGVVA